MLLPSHRAAGETVRALEWIGEKRAAPAPALLKQKLPPATIEELIALRPILPAWMSKPSAKLSQSMADHFLTLYKRDRLESVGVAATGGQRACRDRRQQQSLERRF
jgi:hypothetical protein